jgi:hypothetical protein
MDENRRHGLAVAPWCWRSAVPRRSVAEQSLEKVVAGLLIGLAALL